VKQLKNYGIVRNWLKVSGVQTLIFDIMCMGI